MDCDICNVGLDSSGCYFLTTRQVVLSPRYWERVCAQTAQILAAVMPDTDHEAVAAVVFQEHEIYSAQTSPWAVCDSCAPMFEFDQNIAKAHALAGTQPPGSGPCEDPAIHDAIADGVRRYTSASPDSASTSRHVSSSTSPRRRTWLDRWFRRR